MSVFLRPHGLKHTRLLCVPLSPGVCSDSCPLRWWSNHFILCPLLLPSVFPNIIGKMSWLFHQVAKVLEFQQQSFQWIFKSWFPLGLTDLISLQSLKLSRVWSSTTVQKHQLLGTQPSSWPHSLSCWKNHSFHYTDHCWRSGVCAFFTHWLVCHGFPSQEQASFKFMAVVTIHSVSGEKEVCLCLCFCPVFAMNWWDQRL